MIAGSGKENEKCLLDVSDFKHKLLKSAVIYGANASGKTKLLEAMELMRDMVCDLSQRYSAGDELPYNPYLFSEKTEKAPSSFEASFITNSGIRYRYGFSSTNKTITGEWLYQGNKRGESLIFNRENQQFNIKGKIKQKKILQEMTRENALFVSTAAQLNEPTCKSVIEWFKGLRTFVDDRIPPVAISLLSKDEKFRNAIIENIKIVDPSISDIKCKHEEIANDKLHGNLRSYRRRPKRDVVFMFDGEKRIEVSVETFHRKVNSDDSTSVVSLDLTEESLGTRKFVSLLPYLINDILSNTIFAIDELESSLHPKMLEFIINLYNSHTNSASQLIFTTHNPWIMRSDLFRRDQIWFTEKDEDGASSLYSLDEFKPEGKKVRTDESYAKNYLLGKYGAVPFIPEDPCI
jgi:AAA15 family ATPase/GTPase